MNMGYDYCIQNELVIEYNDNSGKICTIYTNRVINNRCLSLTNKNDFTDFDTNRVIYMIEIEKKINDNTYNKILFENAEWTNESYKIKYERYLLKRYPEIKKIIKVYKKYSAWKSS